MLYNMYICHIYLLHNMVYNYFKRPYDTNAIYHAITIFISLPMLFTNAIYHAIYQFYKPFSPMLFTMLLHLLLVYDAIAE